MLHMLSISKARYATVSKNVWTCWISTNYSAQIPSERFPYMIGHHAEMKESFLLKLLKMGKVNLQNM